MVESCRRGMGIGFALADRCRRFQKLVLPARRVRVWGQALVPRSSLPESLREAFCGDGVRVQGSVRRPAAGERQRLRARNRAGARLSARAGKRADRFFGYCRGDVHLRLRFLELKRRGAGLVSRTDPDRVSPIQDSNRQRELVARRDGCTAYALLLPAIVLIYGGWFRIMTKEPPFSGLDRSWTRTINTASSRR